MRVAQMSDSATSTGGAVDRESMDAGRSDADAVRPDAATDAGARRGSIGVASWLITTARAMAVQPKVHLRVLTDAVRLVRERRTLLLELVRREITDQFAGSMAGAAWSVLHPLLQMFVYVGVFAFIFRVRPPMGESINPYGFDFTVQMISAYLPFIVFMNMLGAAPAAVSGQANLVKQVVFPIELLPLRCVLAALLPQVVGTVFLLAYTLIKFGTLPWTWIFWPLLIPFQILAVAGIAYALAALGVYFRDIRDITRVLATVLLYLTPILYTEAMLESNEDMGWLVAVLKANPLSWLVWPFRDVAFYGSFQHPWAWVVMPIGSIVIFVAGWRIFRRLKPYFGNAL
ncbi:MAG: ABC transporter permease [Planctomycetota bacterium]